MSWRTVINCGFQRRTNYPIHIEIDGATQAALKKIANAMTESTTG
jgi:hypothetical protein